ncbi:hypothetical protein HDF14_004062 [Edaphobacter lichenicola]|uniref:Uncharacterized protein n=1 Tax=Tunturiibacter gelidiferens TaxID=3069689 RepID=A0A9X0U703_9BACT|nr:hypothetical protein [Edaphobacter lichenicola]MBB5330427.1 hypothetical protein [Edaphobacter lichenicola]
MSWLMVEGRGWWKYGRPSEGDRLQVTYVDQAQRSLACDGYELAALLKAYVSGASKQVNAGARGDRGFASKAFPNSGRFETTPLMRA